MLTNFIRFVIIDYFLYTKPITICHLQTTFLFNYIIIVYNTHVYNIFIIYTYKNNLCLKIICYKIAAASRSDVI